MATLDSHRTHAFTAASRALDHAIDATLAGRATHPSGTTFVPADLAASGRLSAYRRLGPVSIIDGEGNAVRLEQDRGRGSVLALGLLGLALWLAARRTRAAA